jgi:glycerol-3-phosphate responsive antiterminator
MATREHFDGGSFNFEKDLFKGHNVEREFGQLLKKNPDVLDISYNDNKKYDIKVTKKGGMVYTFEVKNDMMEARTGNIGIEFQSRGNPSGIATTDADIWVQKLKDGFWMIWREVLVDLVAAKKYWKIVSGGDDGTSQLYLFKREDIINEMKIYGD